MKLTKKMKIRIALKVAKNNVAQILMCAMLIISGIAFIVIPKDGTGGLFIMLLALAYVGDTYDKTSKEYNVLSERKIRILEEARRKRKERLVRQLEMFDQTIY